MRHESTGHAFGHQRVRFAGSEPGVDEHAGDEPMRLEMQLPVVDARPDPVHDVLLQRLHAPDEIRKQRIAVAVCTCDVRCIAVDLCAGVDQERAALAGGLTLEIRVVQDRSVLVECDDVAVRQLTLCVTGRLAESLMDGELRQALVEGFGSRDMAERGAPCRETHAGQFVAGLRRTARVVQDVDRCGGIDAVDAESVAVVIDFTDKDALLAALRQVPGDILEFVHDSNVEIRRPVTVRAAGHGVPVVPRLIVDKYGRVTRRVDDAGQRQPGQWRPAHEVGIGSKRVGIVVEKGVFGGAGEDHCVRSAGALERMIVPPAYLLDMLPVERPEFRVLVAEVQVHWPNHTGSQTAVRV